MSLTLPLPTTKTAADTRTAVVLAHGVGIPAVTCFVRDETGERHVLLGAPAVGSRVRIERCPKADGSHYWQLAGGTP